MNIDKANDNNNNDEEEYIEDNNYNNEIEINIKEQVMYINEYKYESDDQENIYIANEEDDVLLNDKDNLSTMDKNEEKYESLKYNIDSTESEDHKILESEEVV